VRIVYVTQELPTAPLTGAHTRTLSMLAALTRRHEVAIVGRLPAGRETVAVQDLCVDVWAVRCAAEDHRSPLRRSLSSARKAFTPVPLVAQSRDDGLARAVDDAVAAHSPSVVQLFNMYTVHYRRAERATVLDLPDVVSGLCESAAGARPLKYVAAGIQRRRAEQAERRLLRDVYPVTINGDDADRLARLGIDAFTVPLAIGLPEPVDSSTGEDSDHMRPSRPMPDEPLRLLFVGSYLHRPNVEAGRFLERLLMPALSARGCHFQLTIAGRGVRPLSAERVSNAARHAGGRIRHLADVPDLAPLYREADIVVIPLAHGGGTKNKTLEAMAWGRPVVGSPQAFTGLGSRAAGACEVVPLAANAFADAVVALSRDPGRRAAMGRAGREYVAREHSQEIVNRRVDVLYDAIAAGGSIADARRALEQERDDDQRTDDV